MAEIYNAPKEIKRPKFDWDNTDKYDKDCDKFKAELKTFLLENVSKGKLVGEIIRFPVGDGHAEYMLASMSPLKLVELDLGDAWRFEYAHLLTAKEVKEKLAQQKKMGEFFASHKK